MTGAEGYKLGVSRLRKPRNFVTLAMCTKGSAEDLGKLESLCLMLKEDSTGAPVWLSRLSV